VAAKRPGRGVQSRQVGSSRAFVLGRNAQAAPIASHTRPHRGDMLCSAAQVADIVIEDPSISRAQAAAPRHRLLQTARATCRAHGSARGRRR
jgi:hypothetical protein